MAIPFDALAKLDARLSLRVARLERRELLLRDVVLDAGIEAGALTLNDLSMHARSGFLRARGAIEPADGAALDSFRFSWGAVHGVRGYRLEIAEDVAFTRVVYAVTESGAIHEPPTAALPDGNEPLYWRVSTIDGDGYRSAPSEVRSFTLAR